MSGQLNNPAPVLRIGLIGPLPPPSGGMANQTLQLARLLDMAGVAVDVVQVNLPYSPRWIERLPLIRAMFRLFPYLRRLWGAAGRNDVLHVMANSGWSWHLFAAPAIWAAHLRGTPAVVNYRGGEAEPFLRQAGAVVRFSIRRASALVVPSEFLRQIFARFGMEARIVPNIVDLTMFHPSDIAPGGIHIVLARNLERLYDIASGLRAMAVLSRTFPAARMSVAGSGPELERLTELAAELGIADRVSFTGRLDRNQMADLYRTATISLNTSLADNMPNSVLEALASGVPVVSTNAGGVPFLVEHRSTALLVEPGDVEAMAASMMQLIQNDSLRRNLVRNGLEYVQQFTWERVGKLWLQTYREAQV